MANATHAGADVPPSSSYGERTEHHGSSPVALIVVCIVLAVVCIVLAVKLHSEAAVASQTRTELTQSTAAQAQSQADLEKARTQESDLQNRITASQSSQADLQSQLNQSKAGAADLQNKLTAEQAKQADLQSQIDKANSQASDAQSQLAAAQGQRGDLQAQLDKANAHSADLQSQLDKAKAGTDEAQAGAAASRVMPVAAFLEKSSWNHWYTLRMHSSASRPLDLQVEITDMGNTRTENVTLQPGATDSIHRLHSGAWVKVTGAGYDTLSVMAQ